MDTRYRRGVSRASGIGYRHPRHHLTAERRPVRARGCRSMRKTASAARAIFGPRLILIFALGLTPRLHFGAKFEGQPILLGLDWQSEGRRPLDLADRWGILRRMPPLGHVDARPKYFRIGTARVRANA